MTMNGEANNLGGGPLTRTELIIVLVVAIVLGVIITSTLARANRVEHDTLAKELDLGAPLVHPEKSGLGKPGLAYPLGSNVLGANPLDTTSSEWNLSNGLGVNGAIVPFTTNSAGGWKTGKE